MSQRFGTRVDPAAFIELIGTGLNPPPRPTQADLDNGLILMARRGDTHAALPNIDIEPDTGYWNYTSADDDVQKIEISIDGGTTWIPRWSAEAMDQAILAGSVANAALTAATAANTALGDLTDTIGAPSGLATLDGDGQVTSSQIAALVPVLQNGDGTWDPRPDTNYPVRWWRTVPGSAGPATAGTTADGAGMVDGFDELVDIAADLAA